MTFEVPLIDLQTILNLGKSVMTVVRFYVSVIVAFIV